MPERHAGGGCHGIGGGEGAASRRQRARRDADTPRRAQATHHRAHPRRGARRLPQGGVLRRLGGGNRGAAAGVSRQTFYQYFRNKNAVIELLLSIPSNVGRGALEALAALDEPTLKDLEKVIEFQMDVYETNKTTFAIIAEAEAVEPSIQELIRPVRDRFRNTLAAAIRRSRRRAGAPDRRRESELEALLLSAQLERFCNLWLIRGYEIDRRAAVRILARNWHAAFRGASIGPETT